MLNRQQPPEGRLLARQGPDGVIRSNEEEDRLNQLFAAWLASPLGIECLAHLRAVTIETVGGLNITNDELRHREGQRFVVAYMCQRKALYEKAQHAQSTRRVRAADPSDTDQPAH